MPLDGSPLRYLSDNNSCVVMFDYLRCIYRKLNRKGKAMKEEIRNKIVENIGLAWVYSPVKARSYLNEALRGFAEDRKQQEEAAKRLLDYVFADEKKPKRGKPVVGGTRLLSPKAKQVLKVFVTRPYPITLDTILRNTDVASRMAVHKHIEEIRNAGYNIRTISTGRKKRKYGLGA